MLFEAALLLSWCRLLKVPSRRLLFFFLLPMWNNVKSDLLGPNHSEKPANYTSPSFGFILSPAERLDAKDVLKQCLMTLVGTSICQ